MPVDMCIEGEHSELAEIRVNTGLNFGRIFPEQPLRSFRLAVALEDLAWLCDDWRSTAQEMAVDDQLDEEPSPFHVVDYEPILAHAWQNPTAFVAIVDMFFTRTILEHFFASTDARGIWTINGVSSILIEDERLIFLGWVVR